MAELSPEEVQRAKEILNSFYTANDNSALNELFTIIDRDGSGSLEANELEPIFSAISGRDFTEGQLEAIIKAADADGNSTIEINEFEGLLTNDSVRAILA
jgi:Ca2+-binding EF-hand superfamily protein